MNDRNDGNLIMSGSANKLYRKPSTSPIVSGPPKLSSKTPTFVGTAKFPAFITFDLIEEVLISLLERALTSAGVALESLYCSLLLLKASFRADLLMRMNEISRRLRTKLRIISRAHATSLVLTDLTISPTNPSHPTIDAVGTGIVEKERGSEYTSLNRVNAREGLLVGRVTAIFFK